MKDFLRYRAWDKKLKRMGWVYNIQFINTPPIIGDIIVSFDNDGQDWQQETYNKKNLNNHVVVMMEIGLKDDNNVSIFEEDLLECLFQHPITGFMEKLRGRVIWNPHLSYGEYGFIIIDEHGGLHPFKSVDAIKVIGNSFQGVTQTT